MGSPLRVLGASPPSSDCVQGLARAQRQLGSRRSASAWSWGEPLASLCLPGSFVPPVGLSELEGPRLRNARPTACECRRFVHLRASASLQRLSLGARDGQVPARSVTPAHNSHSKAAGRVRQGVGTSSRPGKDSIFLDTCGPV